MEGISRAFKAHRLNQWQAWLERVVVWGGAICTGLLVVAFARFSDWGGEVFSQARSHLGWAAALCTPVAGMLIVAIKLRWFQGSEGSGIPQTIAALQPDAGPEVAGRFLSFRVACGKFFLGGLALASGFSVGREGPSVQIGASIMYGFRRLLPAGNVIQSRDMILAGGAAGIAAAFNTPLAGIVFAIEELSRRFEQRASGVLLTAIVLSGLVSISLQGNYLYFGHLTVSMIDFRIIAPLLTCGLVCGVLGGSTSRVLLYSTRPWSGVTGRLRQGRPVVFAGCCGLAVAALGLLTEGSINGSGYQITRGMLSGQEDVAWY
ncbi:MAG: chloride channel protein, partial [Perlucidibaca sp.]